MTLFGLADVTRVSETETRRVPETQRTHQDAPGAVALAARRSELSIRSDTLLGWRDLFGRLCELESRDNL
jgi:hypothetical protein